MIVIEKCLRCMLCLQVDQFYTSIPAKVSEQTADLVTGEQYNSEITFKKKSKIMSVFVHFLCNGRRN